jgi:hypothetical protein
VNHSNLVSGAQGAKILDVAQNLARSANFQDSLRPESAGCIDKQDTTALLDAIYSGRETELCLS